MLHLLLHFLVPAFVAGAFFRPEWRKAFLVMIGTMLVDGIFNRDFPVIQGAMLFIIVCVLIINLITDVCYAAIDPRVKY